MSKSVRMESDELRALCTIISQSENAQVKFKKGTSPYSLLKNRIRALRTAVSCITGDDADALTLEDLNAALKPLASIISKSEKARGSFTEGSGHYDRLSRIIDAVALAMQEVETEIGKRGG